jgi:hypothetical protein
MRQIILRRDATVIGNCNEPYDRGRKDHNGDLRRDVGDGEHAEITISGIPHPPGRSQGGLTGGNPPSLGCSVDLGNKDSQGGANQIQR